MNKINNYENVFVHKSSYLDEDVKIGQGTKIWHFSHILKNCKLVKTVLLDKMLSLVQMYN